MNSDFIALQNAIREQATATQAALQALSEWERSSGIHRRDAQLVEMAKQYRPYVRAGKIAPTLAYGPLPGSGREPAPAAPRGTEPAPPATAVTEAVLEVDETIEDSPIVRAAAEKERGNILFAAGDLGGARAAYTRAIRLAPSVPAHRLNRALIAMRLGEWQDVVDDATGALACAGSTPLPKALLRRGHALARLGRVGEALADLEEAALMLPEALQPQVAAEIDAVHRLEFELTHPAPEKSAPPKPAPTPVTRVPVVIEEEEDGEEEEVEKPVEEHEKAAPAPAPTNGPAGSAQTAGGVPVMTFASIARTRKKKSSTQRSAAAALAARASKRLQ